MVERRNLTRDAEALIASNRENSKSLDDSSFSEAATEVEKTLGEFGASMTCRFELVCNTSGVCEVKLVCTF